MPKKIRPIALLPWLDLREEVRIGNVLFWPYDQMKNEYLPSCYSAGQVDKYAHIFYAINGKAAKVTCISYSIEPEAKFAPRHGREALRAWHALFASSYVGGLVRPALDNGIEQVPSAEHFTLYPLPTAEGISKGTWSFSYPRTLTVGVIGDGWRIEQPDHLHRWNNIRLFKPLLNAYRSAIESKHCDLPYLWRSLEWFFYSQSTQSHLTEEARLILLCIAIEAAICGTPFSSGTKAFVGKVGEATKKLELPKRHVCYVDSKTKKKTSGSKLQKWAYELYLLRSSLLHSDIGKKTSIVWDTSPCPVYHHFIAPYVWFECLWHTIEGMGLIPSPPEDDGPATLPGVLALSRWYHRWEMDIEFLRKWWQDFLTGQHDRCDDR